MSRFFTIGHSTRTQEELKEILRDARIDAVIDVRRFPGSKRHPHLGREELQRSLPASDISYEWWGEELGGRRSPRPASRHIAWRNVSFRGYADHIDTEAFRSAIEELERRAATERLAFMCAEAVWWRCHRRLIADALLLRSHEVEHLGLGRHEEHRLHPNVRAGEDGWPVYDVNVDLPLELP